MSNAVIYCRVSTQEQASNLSLSTQRKACLDYCARFGLDVAKVFTEEGASAKTADRPEFQKLLAYCKEKKNDIQFVVVYSVSRFAREKHSHFAVRAYLRKLGITLRSVTEPIDDSSTGNLMEGVLAAFSQFDNDVRSERTVAGMRAASEQGRWTFPTPLGYLRVSTDNGRTTLIPDPQHGPLIRRGFELLATGQYNKEQLRRLLTDEGLRTRRGNRVSAQTFSKILRNPIYQGRIVLPVWGVDCAATFEGIVPKEVFQLTQRVLDGKSMKVATHNLENPDFPLRRFVRCDGCGSPLTGSWSRGRKKRYAYYRCPKSACRKVNISKIQLEQKFNDLLEYLQPQPRYVKLLNAMVLDAWKDRQKGVQTEVANLTRKLDDLAERKQKLVTAFVYENRIDSETYQSELGRLKNERSVAEHRLQGLSLGTIDVEALLNFATTLFKDVAQFWRLCQADEKSRVQRVLFSDGVTFDGGNFGTGVTCLAFNWLPQIAGGNTNLASRTGFEPVSPP